MRIIKNKQIIEDNWRHIDNDKPLQSGDISISFQRWLSEKDQLANHKGRLGLRLASTDNIACISDDLNKFDLIELDFSAFTDGRSFSMATLLKQRYHFNGEIRATGNFIRDQIFYLSRVGVNAFNLADENELEGAVAALNEFTVQYQ